MMSDIDTWAEDTRRMLCRSDARDLERAAWVLRMRARKRDGFWVTLLGEILTGAARQVRKGAGDG